MGSQLAQVPAQTASVQSVPSHPLEIRQSVGMLIKCLLIFSHNDQYSVNGLTEMICECIQESESEEKRMEMEERVDIHRPVSYSKRQLVERVYLISLTLNLLPPSPLPTT